jgi:hypothetical protein
LRLVRHVLACGLLLATAAAHAQGGPPMLSDDPETVPDGHWELNLAVTGLRTDSTRDLEWLRVDLNYGYGERMQLKFEVPVTSHTELGASHAGLGSSNVGVRIRFIDEDRAGVAVSTYPQYSFDLLASSARHGVTSGDGEFFLPVQIAHNFGAWSLGGEVGHSFVESGPDENVAGLVAGADCLARVECLAEVRHWRSPDASASVLNFGSRVQLNRSANLLVSAGHGIGHDSPDRPDWVFYLALQLMH